MGRYPALQTPTLVTMTSPDWSQLANKLEPGPENLMSVTMVECSLSSVLAAVALFSARMLPCLSP